MGSLILIFFSMHFPNLHICWTFDINLCFDYRLFWYLYQL